MGSCVPLHCCILVLFDVIEIPSRLPPIASGVPLLSIPRLVLQMMRRAFRAGYQPTESAYAMCLMAAGLLGEADFAKLVFDKRIAAGFGVKEEAYSSVRENTLADITIVFVVETFPTRRRMKR